MSRSWWTEYVRRIAVGAIGLGLGAVLGFLSPGIAIGLVFGIWLYGLCALWDKSGIRLRSKWYISGSTFVLATILTWYLPSVLIKAKIDENRIYLVLQYAHEWDNYKKATNYHKNMAKIIDEPIVVRDTQQERRLLLAVVHGNKEATLVNVSLYLELLDDGLTIRREPPWQSMDPNKQYFVRLGNINEGPGVNPPGNLFIKFPGPGNYEVNYTIAGDNFTTIRRQFVIILTAR